jgi:hypothetical protein
MVDMVGVVRVGSLEHLLEVIQGTLDGCLLALAFCGGLERILRLLLAPLLLFLRPVGGALPGVLVLLGLALGVVKNHSDHLLARRVAGGDVEELLGGLWALASQLVDQGITGYH